MFIDLCKNQNMVFYFLREHMHVENRFKKKLLTSDDS